MEGRSRPVAGAPLGYRSRKIKDGIMVSRKGIPAFLLILLCMLLTPVVRGQDRIAQPVITIVESDAVFGTEGGGRLDNGGEEGGGGEIETDRDSFTPATTTTGRGHLIVEAAWTFEDNRRVRDTNSFPELIFRYGVTDRLELRLGWDYDVGGKSSETSGSTNSGDEFLDPDGLERDSHLAYGFKYLVTRQNAGIPGSSVIVQGFTPTSGESNQSNIVATYVFGWKLPNEWQLDAAMRYGTGFESGDHFNKWAPSVVLKVPFCNEKCHVHAEYFAIVSTHKADNFNRQFFSPGIAYLVTSDLEVGVRVGWGLNDESARFFSNAGFGWQF